MAGWFLPYADFPSLPRGHVREQAVVSSSSAQAARSCTRTKTEELCGFHDDWIVDFKRTD
jgi:hypothetical protein